jgi:hypothetical protein
MQIVKNQVDMRTSPGTHIHRKLNCPLHLHLLLLLLQPSDDDLGSKESADIAVVGRWYARIA